MYVVSAWQIRSACQVSMFAMLRAMHSVGQCTGSVCQHARSWQGQGMLLGKIAEGAQRVSRPAAVTTRFLELIELVEVGCGGVDCRRSRHWRLNPKTPPKPQNPSSFSIKFNITGIKCQL